MTYDEWIVAVATEAPKRTGTALKLLLHLASVSIQTGSSQVRTSDRELESQLGISRPALTEAKRNLADLVAIESRAGVASVFNLPATWFPGQRTLFQQPVAKFPSHQWQTKLATGGQQSEPALANKISHSGQQSEPLWPGNLATVANKVSHSGQQSEPLGQETWPPATQNQQDTDGLSNSISNSEVSVEEKQYVISILSKRHLPSSQRQDATMLAAELQHAMWKLGAVEVAEKPPDDGLLSQCLAVAPLRELLPAIKQASYRKSKPRGYPWFVTVLLESLKGIPRTHTKAVLIEMQQTRQSKPPGRAETLPFPDQMGRIAANQVKTLR